VCCWQRTAVHKAFWPVLANATYHSATTAPRLFKNPLGDIVFLPHILNTLKPLTSSVANTHPLKGGQYHPEEQHRAARYSAAVERGSLLSKDCRHTFRPLPHQLVLCMWQCLLALSKGREATAPRIMQLCDGSIMQLVVHRTHHLQLVVHRNHALLACAGAADIHQEKSKRCPTCHAF
jgi:hypothetical protein